MIAAVTSGKILGNCATSVGLNLIFLGFLTISNSVANKFLGSFKVITPLLCNKINALPPFDGSFGIAIVSPFFKSLIDLIFLEYNPSGSTWTFPIETRFNFLSSMNLSR
jgi:hypothetical protein